MDALIRVAVWGNEKNNVSNDLRSFWISCSSNRFWKNHFQVSGPFFAEIYTDTIGGWSLLLFSLNRSINHISFKRYVLIPLQTMDGGGCYVQK